MRASTKYLEHGGISSQGIYVTVEVKDISDIEFVIMTSTWLLVSLALVNKCCRKRRQLN